MKNWRLTVLGASSSITPPRESTASLHLGNGEKSILIDAGGNIPRRLEENNIDYRKLTDVFLTHSHPDHIYGFPFLSHCFYQQHHKITCRAPEEAVPRLKQALEAFDLNQSDKYLRVNFQPLPVNKIQEFTVANKITIKSVPTKHSRGGVGYFFKSKNQKLFFTSDTAPNDNLKEVGKNADILMIDCQAIEGYKRYFRGSHCSALEVGNLATELEVKTVVPFHYNTTEFPNTWPEIGEEIRENFEGTIIKPHRGMAFTL